MPTIKEIRASSRRCNVKVALGVSDIGTTVTVDIVLDRTKQEVQDAFAALENLALREAKEQVGEAASRPEIERRAEERAAKLVKAANGRTHGAVRQALSELKRSVMDLVPARTAEMSASEAGYQMRSRAVDAIEHAMQPYDERKAG